MISGSVVRVGQVPARIERLTAEKRYYAAVQLHLQSISMLDREGIQSVSTVDMSPVAGMEEMQTA